MQLSDADILSTYAGVRPVVNTGKADPSAEAATMGVAGKRFC